jgi:4-hydroxy-3-polyprenylbenzoate decarboxylase
MARIIVGISGASGIVLAYRALDALTSLGHDVELVMTRDACLTVVEEMGGDYGIPEKLVAKLPVEQQGKIAIHKIQDFMSGIASGTYKVDGMLVIPCSMSTLAAIRMGLSDNLLRRAADVTIKERRRLVIVPRESPFSEIHLENMLALSRMGVSIVPPIPAWYNKPTSLEDVENFIVGRALDMLGIEHGLYQRWG